MSLLLEALKKAEEAKRRKAQDAGAVAGSGALAPSNSPASNLQPNKPEDVAPPEHLADQLSLAPLPDAPPPTPSAISLTPLPSAPLAPLDIGKELDFPALEPRQEALLVEQDIESAQPPVVELDETLPVLQEVVEEAPLPSLEPVAELRQEAVLGLGEPLLATPEPPPVAPAEVLPEVSPALAAAPSLPPDEGLTFVAVAEPRVDPVLQPVLEPVLETPPTHPVQAPQPEQIEVSQSIEPTPHPEPAQALRLPVADPQAMAQLRAQAQAQLSPEAKQALLGAGGGQTRARFGLSKRSALLLAGLMLGLVLGGGAWFWLQMQQQPSALLANPSAYPAPPPAPPETALVAGPTKEASPPVAATPPQHGQASPTRASAPLRVAAPRVVAPRVQRRPPAPALPPAPQDRAKVVEPSPPKPQGGDIHFVRAAVSDGVAPKVAQAYQAFLQGSYAEAGRLYREQLEHDPSSRDAVLGLAASALKLGRVEEASGLYRRLLALDPKDELAQAALASLSGFAGQQGREYRLRALYEQNAQPETASALGGLLAQAGRWREAQDYYFKAHTSDPEQADYAYNLAISLDALGERALARRYYEMALRLAQLRPPSFKPETIRERLAQLQ